MGKELVPGMYKYAKCLNTWDVLVLFALPFEAC